MNKSTNKSKRPELVLPKKVYYTLQDVFKINGSQFKDIKITMTVRHTKKIEEGKTIEIGSISGEHGRPQKVYALTPVTKEVLDKAEENKINLVDNARQRFINAVNVVTTPSINSSSPAVSSIIPRGIMVER